MTVHPSSLRGAKALGAERGVAEDSAGQKAAKRKVEGLVPKMATVGTSRGMQEAEDRNVRSRRQTFVFASNYLHCPTLWIGPSSDRLGMAGRIAQSLIRGGKLCPDELFGVQTRSKRLK